jgi:hypothetical protein
MDSGTTCSRNPLAVSVRPHSYATMTNIKFQILQPNDLISFQLIADWYLSEWKIPINKTIQRLQNITEDGSQFQVLMTLDSIPISTGGLYNHVGLLDKEPRLKIYKHWLALVYTTPENRHKGYGTLICDYIQNRSKQIGVDTMYLFTDTAEKLYTRLGWAAMENIIFGERNITVMNKKL